ncbi:MAG: sulfurtransferase [Geminicoccaceae bacterium]
MRLLALSLVLTGSIAAAASAAEPLVSADWLEGQLGTPDLRIVDIRSGDDAATAFAQGHVPGAVHADYGKAGWRTEVAGVPGMTPEVASLEALIGGLGIDNASHVVIVYSGADASDFGAAARVYWTFDYLGHDEVSILDGGWRGWTEGAGRPVATGAASVTPATFTAEVRPALLIETAEVERSLGDPAVLRLDARPRSQYTGETKAGPARAPGRLPDALGLEQAVFFSADGRLKERGEIAALVPAEVTDSGIETVVSYCNTGHWAATNWFVLSELLGQENVRLYDASMTGWSADPARPLETGESTLDLVSRWVGVGCDTC